MNLYTRRDCIATGVEITMPQGMLTKDQLEIMELIWEADRPLTAAEVWQVLSARRKIARTTVVTLVKRLAKRGWINQTGEARGATYSAACDRPEATNRLTTDFLDRFFGGSPSKFVMNLVGSDSLSEAEVSNLRQILKDYEEGRG